MSSLFKSASEILRRAAITNEYMSVACHILHEMEFKIIFQVMKAVYMKTAIFWIVYILRIFNLKTPQLKSCEFKLLFEDKENTTLRHTRKKNILRLL